MRVASIALFVAGLFLKDAVASPLQLSANINTNDDATILNYLLTIKHMENALVHSGLSRFSAQSFTDTGLPDTVREWFQHIADHEVAHVQYLSDALGNQATQPCTYSFPYTNPIEFSGLSHGISGLSASAFAGATRYLTNKDHVSAVESMFSLDARHTSWVGSNVIRISPWGGAFDVALDINLGYTLVSHFMTSCPSKNPTLPFTAYPTLELASPAPGNTSQVSSQSLIPPTFIALFAGLSPLFIPIKDGVVTLPKELYGQIYVVGTTSGVRADSETIVSGPAVLGFEYNSKNELIYAGQDNQ